MYYGEKVLLRAYKEEDIKKAYEYVNDLEVKRLLDPNIPFPIAEWEETSWIKSERNKNGMIYDFAIEDIVTGNYIGGCSINSASIKNRNCTIGIMIGDKEYWNKGYGRDALKVLIKFIFEEYNLDKIKLSTYSFNARAIACYKAVGFKEEGVLKRELFREGKYCDEILMALFKEDFFNKNHIAK